MILVTSVVIGLFLIVFASIWDRRNEQLAIILMAAGLVVLVGGIGMGFFL